MKELEVFELGVVAITTGKRVFYRVFDTYEQANAAAYRWKKACPHYRIAVWRI